MPDDLREALAAIFHDSWAAWTMWQLEHMTPEYIAGWQRQIATPYADLTEREKNADREWADKVLTLVRGAEAQ